MGNRQDRYQRILVKISGEALDGFHQFHLGEKKKIDLPAMIDEIYQMGVEIAIVIGAGNLFRGINGAAMHLQRTPADQIGMLATLMNAITLQQQLLYRGCEAKVMSAFPCDAFAERYQWAKAHQYLKEKKILIFAGGTGNPYFTTDTAAALRAAEIEADILLKGTKVDGVFTDDPLRNPKAEKLPKVTYTEILEKRLNIMDQTAIAFCRDHKMPICVFDLFSKGALKKAVLKEPVGSIIGRGDEG